jgi:hypothetical protein
MRDVQRGDHLASGVHSNFFRWGLRQEFFSGVWVQQIQSRTDGRENGDLRAVAP